MRSANIMIVEDDLLIAEDLKQTLEGFGYSVTGVEDNGTGAIKRAGDTNPDLILMDVMINGDMTGIEAAFRITSNSKVPVIFLTAFADDATIKKAMKVNPYGYILKPFKKNELYAGIEVALFKSKKDKYERKIEDLLDDETLRDIYLKSNVKQDPAEAIFLRNIVSRSPGVIDESIDSGKILPGIHHETIYDKQLRRYNTDLLTLVDGVISGSISEHHLSILAKTCTKIASMKVTKHYTRLSTVNRVWELSIDDVAIDAVASLFTYNNKMKMINLKSALIKYSNSIETGKEALSALGKVIDMAIYQNINKILRESDLFFSKTLDIINYGLRKGDVKKVNHWGVAYLVLEGADHSDKRFIDPEEFAGIEIDPTVPEMEAVSKLFDYLERNTDYSPAVPLNAFIEKYLFCSRNHVESLPAADTEFFGRYSVHDILDKSLSFTFKRLEKYYAGKYSDREITLFKKSLVSIAEDMRAGHGSWAIHEYFIAAAGSMTKAEYEEKYRNILEYLLKIFKSHAAALLN